MSQLTSISALVSQRAASAGSETILRTKNRGIWKAVTWEQLDAKVRAIGTALLAAGFGRGDAMAIVSETRPEAAYADLAILGCGAASVAINPDDDADRVRHILSSTVSRVIFVESEEQLDKILTIRGRCPALSHIVVFDMKGLRDFNDAGCISLAAFTETGGAADWTASVQATEADQPAVIQFPRGESTGPGRTITHGDVMQALGAARTHLAIQRNDERLAVLHLADITERVWGLYLALDSGCISNYPEAPDTVIENLQELQPTVLGADAVVWDHLQALATARAAAATSTQRMTYEWAVKAGNRGGAMGLLAGFLVLHAVKREFGLNRLRVAYSGGASVSPRTLDWAASLGIVIRRLDDPGKGGGQFDERRQAQMQNASA